MATSLGIIFSANSLENIYVNMSEINMNGENRNAKKN